MAAVAGVAIRPATPDDARAIAEVHVAAWRWAYDGLLPSSLLDALSVDERTDGWDTILGGCDDDVTVAVDGAANVVGFVSVGHGRDDDAPAGAGELLALYLLPHAAGTGIGRALLDHAEAALRASGARRATLWVLETNERARRFYERNGWAWDGTHGEHRFECGNRPIVRYAKEL